MDENNKFYILCKEGHIDLDELLQKLKNLNLSIEQEVKEFKFKESENNLLTIYVKKRKTDYLLRLEGKKICLYNNYIILETANKKEFKIYLEKQINWLIKDKLKIEENYSFYLTGKIGKPLETSEFINYPGERIKLLINPNLETKDYIFKRKTNDIKTLKSLTLNYDKMFESEELGNLVYEDEGRKKFHDEIDLLFESETKKYNYYCGQSGIGKSVSLLD